MRVDLFSHNWLIYALIDPQLERRMSRYFRGRMIDIGCGDKIYESMAAPYVDEHVGLDHRNTSHDKSRVDMFASAYAIPAPDSSFDSALCTDVLEHLEEPSSAVQEMYRVLKPGAYALLTVPLFWHLHEEPRDFYRYTTYGLRYLFEKSGFEVVEITSLSGFVATFAQEFSYFLVRFRRGGARNPLWWLVPPLILFIQTSAYLLNRVDRSPQFTVEYLALIRKPLNAGSGML